MSELVQLDPIVQQIRGWRIAQDLILRLFVGWWEGASEEAQRRCPYRVVYNIRLRPFAVVEKRSGARVCQLRYEMLRTGEDLVVDWVRSSGDLAAIEQAYRELGSTRESEL